MTTWTIHRDDVLATLAALPDNSIDGCVTDPPYGLSDHPDMAAVLSAWLAGEAYAAKGAGFMGKEWDAFVPGPEVWRELYRVLKPGASAFVFAGDRTQDLMGLSLRLAGFELRGVVAWLYGSGFPKSLNLGKAIDRHLGAERPVVGEKEHTPKFAAANNGGFNNVRVGEYGEGSTFPLTAPATDEAAAWEGHGTALKPGYEPAMLVQKPIDGTYAKNALTWAVAGLNVDAARIEALDAGYARNAAGDRGHADNRGRVMDFALGAGRAHDGGRWPANVVIDDHTAACLGDFHRYFYTAKPDRDERDAGLGGFQVRTGGELTDRAEGSAGLNNPRAGAGRNGGGRNVHPTVKPIALTRYLASLLLPPPRAAGPRRLVVPFSGSGSEMIGALLAGWDEIVGIEREAEYAAIAEARLAHWATLDTPKTTPGGQLGLFDHPKGA